MSAEKIKSQKLDEGVPRAPDSVIPAGTDSKALPPSLCAGSLVVLICILSSNVFGGWESGPAASATTLGTRRWRSAKEILLLARPLWPQARTLSDRIGRLSVRISTA